MLIEAAGLAVLAAISPTALLLAAVYLGSARPRATILLYLTGALVMSIIMGIVVLVLLRAGGFSLPHHRTARYGLRLFLGIVILLAGLFVARRKTRGGPPDPAKEGKGIMARLMANPAPYTAFLAGILVFSPGVTFIAAVQVVVPRRSRAHSTASLGLQRMAAPQRPHDPGGHPCGGGSHRRHQRAGRADQERLTPHGPTPTLALDEQAHY